MSHIPNNLSQPYLVNEIGQYFNDPQNTNETARLLAHAALGAASAYLSGNDATSGALGAASGEAIAILVQKELYGDRSSNELTQQEKETIRAVATLASGLVGAMSGGSFEDSATAAAAGYNAAVNNDLSSWIAGKTGGKGAEYFLEDIDPAGRRIIVSMVEGGVSGTIIGVTYGRSLGLYGIAGLGFSGFVYGTGAGFIKGGGLEIFGIGQFIENTTDDFKNTLVDKIKSEK